MLRQRMRHRCAQLARVCTFNHESTCSHASISSHNRFASSSATTNHASNNIPVEDRIVGALYGMFIGDALAWPLHWYYDAGALDAHKSRYYGGRIERFTDLPKELLFRHPSSGDHMKKLLEENDPAITSLIPDSAKSLWRTPNTHWNGTLKKGQNTNTVEVTKLLMESLMDHRGYYRPFDYAKRYIDFFKKHRHNDLYFEGIHQSYFRNLASGKPPLDCGKSMETCLSGLTFPIPLALMYHHNRPAAKSMVAHHTEFSHRSSDMQKQTALIADLLIDLIHGKDPQKCIVETFSKFESGLDIQEIAQKNPGKGWDQHLFGKVVPGLARYQVMMGGAPFSIHCYGAAPGFLYLAYKYLDTPAEALISNANLGGDNTDRGSVLGAILGAAKGSQWIPSHWKNELVDLRRPNVEEFITKFARLAASTSPK